jgi:DNA polymerase
MNVLLADLETRSRVDLKKAGHRRYAADSSTAITTASWVWKGRPNSLTGAVFLPGLTGLGAATPFDFLVALMSADRIVFHNAGFDASVIRQVLKYNIPLRKLSCTMARAQRMSLPGGLDELAKTLGVPGKSQGGNLLVMKTCKPQRDGSFCEDPETFRDLLAYNLQDVRSLVAVDERLPELPPEERRIWERTWRKNEIGLPLDLELAYAVASRRQEIELEVANELRELTNGAVTAVTQRQRIGNWLRSLGVVSTDLRKETIEELLEDEELPPAAREVLEIVVESGGMAPTKATALLERHDAGFYKDHTRYFGARSGRGTSEGVNTFNIARPSGSYDIEAVIRCLKVGAKTGDIKLGKKGPDGERPRVAAPVGNVALTDVLRGMVCAPDGYEVIDADLSNIELRLALWFAGDAERLAILGADGDLYMHNAINALDLPKDATKETHPEERQNFKTVTLGGNYGLGWKKFFASQRRKIPGLTPERAQAWISGYRKDNPKLASKNGLWNNLDTAAREALWRPGFIIEAAGGKIAFCFSADNPWQAAADDVLHIGRQAVLWLRLPAGRAIPHYAPTIDRATGDFHFLRARHGRMLPQKAYGGAWTEIICQSSARDVITRVETQIEAELPDVTIVMDIYDSSVSVAHASIAKQRREQILAIMRRPIPWLPGLPLNAEGHSQQRMAK